MQNKYPYLKNASFLKEVDYLNLKDKYVKITILNFLEKPIKSIEGKITNGNINIDGSSAVRRTANLTVVVDNDDNNILNINNDLSINKKIKIEIGIKNVLPKYTQYPILWYPVGTYVIIDANISHTTSSINIGLSLRDKMCLLNGDVGGIIPASVNFNEIIEETASASKNSYIYVIEGDVDTKNKILITKPNGIEEVDFEDDKYALIMSGYSSTAKSNNTKTTTIYQIIQELVNHFGGEQLGKIIISGVDDRIKQLIQWTGVEELFICRKGENIFLTTDKELVDSEKAKDENFEYEIKTTGDTIGYIYTDFTYPGDLICNAGDSVCSVLDTIKNLLGNYEYFYDLDGNFIFQEKQNYLNTTQAKVEINNMNNNNYLVDMGKGKSIYDFSDGQIITSYSNSPQYSMIKNDFIVWGAKTDSNGTKWPIRYHLAIDEKPKTGNTYNCLKYIDESDNIEQYILPIHYDTLSQLPLIGTDNVYYRIDYVDDEKTQPIDESIFYIYSAEIGGYLQSVFDENNRAEITTTDWRTELYFSGQAAAPYGLDSNYYYAELANEWPKMYDIKEGNFKEHALNYPTDLDFYLDFIDSEAAISEFSVSNIGRRQKVISDDNINCMFEPIVPDLVLIETGKLDTEKNIKECVNKQQDYTLVPSSLFEKTAIGSNFNSAYNMIRDLLYEYTSYNESVSLQTVPIYYLEPNTRITIRDTKSNIYGDFMINSISLPLGENSIMSINCTRALDRI